MITVEEAEPNIMEPPTESPGEKPPSVQAVSPEPAPSSPKAQSTKSAQETTSVQQTTPEPVTPEPAPSSPKAQEVVQQRNMSSEKKKLRRIRTNSKVESVI